MIIAATERGKTMSDVYVKVEGLSDSLLNNVSVKEITEEPLKAFGTALENVKMADVLSLVRCKDCAKRHHGCPMQVWCGPQDDDYCSRGERRGEYMEKRRRFTCPCCKYKERSVRVKKFKYCPECGRKIK